jgi:hypothetical protein
MTKRGPAIMSAGPSSAYTGPRGMAAEWVQSKKVGKKLAKKCKLKKKEPKA